MSPLSGDEASSPVLGSTPLDLSHLPPIMLLGSRAPPGYMDSFGDSLRKCNATVVDDAQEATLFVGLVNTKKRAQFELRRAGVWTEMDEDTDPGVKHSPKRSNDLVIAGSRKRLKLHYRITPKDVPGSDTEESKSPTDHASLGENQFYPWNTLNDSQREEIYVLKLSWLQEALAKDRLESPRDFIVYAGTKTANHEGDKAQASLMSSRLSSETPRTAIRHNSPEEILQRAMADGPSTAAATRFTSAPYGRRRFRDQGHTVKLGMAEPRPKLMDMATESFEDTPDHDMPSVPDWVANNKKYACERPTLQHSPNEDFINLLIKIRLARLLTGDEIGVRAYSSSIAAVAAVNTKFVNPREILRLPGCDVKIANLWIEYRNTGSIKSANEVDNDETLKILNDFYEIWGVGEKTAREFYYDRGWRDRDDILEYGWHTLSRVQQIGLKYYEEFQLGIPRLEVEFILEKVREHAIKVRDDGIEAIVVGGYRRGKVESGDVDIVLSHREFSKTANLVTDIVASLEDEGWITHTLSLHLTGTKRDQATLPFKNRDKIPGSGFDTLDKALVVWQDISWPTENEDRRKNPKAKNPNVHRRVDIIISPWRTVGCAVLGWSGGTTFQRDVRRYAKYVKQWKFDSSGIRSRTNGEVMKLEGENGVDGSMVDAEKVVFAGLGLEYREPEERWTR